MDQDGTWHGGRPWSRPHCARWGSSSLPKKVAGPQFSADLYCGQTARCIKMRLGTEVGLGLRDIVWDVDPATPRRKGTPTQPIFGPCLLWPNGGWMKTPLGTEVPRPRPHCIKRGPSSRERGTAASPLFGPCLLWPRSPISATAELLFYIIV